jgi:YVTN family beta-propeller protein
MKYPHSLFVFLTLTIGAACGDDQPLSPDAGGDANTSTFAHTLYVASSGSLTSYDLASMQARPGEVTGVNGPTDMQVLDDGRLVVNLSGNNEVLFVDGTTMLEITRVPSSLGAGTRPVHGYISPLRQGKQYWLVFHDGNGTLETNTAALIDIVPASPTYLQIVAEVQLGLGHHKASFSNTRERFVVSSLSACEDVLQVFDYSDVSNVQEVAAADAIDLGFDACDTAARNTPAPHGCATSDSLAYCSLTGPGQIASVDIDADTPIFAVHDADGAGAGYTARHPGGQYVYSLQSRPREGDGGVACQIGQIVTVDAASNEVVAQTPLRYKGPDCTDTLAGTDEETAGPGHILITGTRMFITLAGGFGVEDARTRFEVVLDISDPRAPAQLASIPVGAGTGHVNDALSGDGKWVFVANTIDGTVSQIDTATLTVAATLNVLDGPRQVASYGSNEGPSHQTGPNH